MLASTEKNSFAVCVFLDYMTCFETLDRDIPPNEFGRYGVKGIALKFVRSYIDGRRQFVMHNSITSETVEQNIDVIQSSKSGALLYDIYSNDTNYLMTDDKKKVM